MSYLAMILCCGGFALQAHGWKTQAPGMVSLGFLSALIGSLIWLVLSMRRRQWAMAVQSMFFAMFAFWGLT